jgi:hypothetical protein
MSTANSAITYVSATSISLYKSCPMRWYLTYVTGYKEPSNPYKEIGIQVHDYLEKYLKTGELPTDDEIVNKIAGSGLGMLPSAPNPHILTEVDLKDFPLSEKPPVPFLGYIDCLYTADPTCPEVIDHKTCGSLKNKKSQTKLMTDTQMIIYGKHTLDNFPQAKRVRLTHIYYTTKDPYLSNTTSVIVDREHIDREFKAIIEISKEMLEASKGYASDCTKNTSACYSYGVPCFVKSRCETYNMPLSNMNLDFID